MSEPTAPAHTIPSTTTGTETALPAAETTSAATDQNGTPPTQNDGATVVTQANQTKETPPETTAPVQPEPTGGQDAASSEPKAGGLVLHHLNNSRSQRVLWLLEELEVPYTIKYYKRTKEQFAPEELKAIHPLGKAPVITDGDLVIAESGAIIEYLITKYGKGKADLPESATEQQRLDNIYFAHYAEGSLMPLLVNKLIFSITPERAPLLIRPIVRKVFQALNERLIHPQVKNHAALIENHLAKTPSGFFAGGERPTIADFMMLFPMEALASRVPEAQGNQAAEWVKRVHERPAYKRALEKGGEYAYA